MSQETIDVMDTCGDCCSGRCHWGGERSRAGVAAVEADPTADRPCGCARHEASYRYRVQQLRGDKHFPGCHPEHEQGEDNSEGYEPQEVEPCWHCGASTPRGCACSECWENADYVPPSSVYHCVVCRRWWAHMKLNITKITFPGRPDA